MFTLFGKHKALSGRDELLQLKKDMILQSQVNYRHLSEDDLSLFKKKSSKFYMYYIHIYVEG